MTRAPLLDPVHHLGEDVAEWSVWDTTARVVVTEPSMLDRAQRIVEHELADVDAVASRFRADSELMQLQPGANKVSPLFAELLAVALDAALMSDGAVDPTLGHAMHDLGYGRELAFVRDRGEGRARPVVRPLTRWHDVHLGESTVVVPEGIQLDLGATGKAAAADLAARAVTRRLGTGVLVSLGGDLATAGPGPEQGWRIDVIDGLDEPGCTIGLPAGSALATSSTIRRIWTHDGEPMHHIVDPLTLRPATPVWRTVSVIASSCVTANTLTTAAVVKGTSAPNWLRAWGLPARLVDQHRDVLRISGWT